MYLFVTALSCLAIGACLILIPFMLSWTIYTNSLIEGLNWYIKTQYGEDLSTDDIIIIAKKAKALRNKRS